MLLLLEIDKGQPVIKFQAFYPSPCNIKNDSSLHNLLIERTETNLILEMEGEVPT